MNLADEIRKKFANLTPNKYWKIKETDPMYPAWAIRSTDEYAVGFEVNNSTEVNEAFANVMYYTGFFEIDGRQRKLLLLSSSDESLRYEFAGICALFLETGENGGKREDIIKNPVKWWEKWKKLLGNKNVDQSVHAVLGELIVLYTLGINDETIKSENWKGPEASSFDIQTSSGHYEVKTSLVKYNDIVTISGQYQLTSEEELSLMFVKLEEDVDGISISSMLSELTKLGFDYQDLNKKVNSFGFKENSIARNTQFRLLELREYAVDQNFPFIDTNTLDRLSNREHILQINYKVDLKGLDYKLIDPELNI